jgi:Trk K+ transport system NAD-binding subunit
MRPVSFAAHALKQRQIPVNLVERDAGLQSELAGVADRLILGDAADRHVLDRAGVAAAPSILLTTHDDAMNIYLTVYCRRLNPDARILTRVTHERNVEAVQRAGADFVLSYASLGVQMIFSIVQGRELVVLAEGVDLFYLPVPKSLWRRTVLDAAVGAQTGLNVIGIQEDGRIVTDRPSERTLAPGSSLLAFGTAEQRQRFTSVFR